MNRSRMEDYGDNGYPIKRDSSASSRERITITHLEWYARPDEDCKNIEFTLRDASLFRLDMLPLSMRGEVETVINKLTSEGKMKNPVFKLTEGRVFRLDVESTVDVGGLVPFVGFIDQSVYNNENLEA